MTSAAKYEAQSPQSIMNHFKAPERRPSWFMVSLKQWRKSNAIAPEPPPSAEAIEAKATDEAAAEAEALLAEFDEDATPPPLPPQSLRFISYASWKGKNNKPFVSYAVPKPPSPPPPLPPARSLLLADIRKKSSAIAPAPPPPPPAANDSPPVRSLLLADIQSGKGASCGRTRHTRAEDAAVVVAECIGLDAAASSHEEFSVVLPPPPPPRRRRY